MLLDEDPATLIHHTIGNFNTDPDKHALGRINESLSALQQARDLRLREAENALKKLSRNLSSLQTHHNETVASHDPADHASQIFSLDTQKFRIAKAASDMEIEGERLDQELEILKSRLQDLELQGLEGGETERGKRDLEDETILKLKVYRSLGIDIESDHAGNYNKAVIRNIQKADVHVMNLDPKFSKFFYANYLWQSM
ncbi:Spc24-domain-containing protein [Xylona heveae TC161]|uniref:Kinetochore protein Spc24 n=1 Tax=Xylona heveae (strain CBS 132557 / TC161) TaxID=1328760 RepID=A0A165HF76_XYLHT|nr:Spc24-domain-containing protein [Xylona heveae TC161]KZF23421.1 Spc24-domain-containing protein [Xylona heveae TC161]